MTEERLHKLQKKAAEVLKREIPQLLVEGEQIVIALTTCQYPRGARLGYPEPVYLTKDGAFTPIEELRRTK